MKKKELEAWRKFQNRIIEGEGHSQQIGVMSFLQQEKETHTKEKEEQPTNNLRLINEFKNAKKDTAGNYIGFLNGLKLKIVEKAWETKISSFGSNTLSWSLPVLSWQVIKRKISYINWEGFLWSRSTLVKLADLSSVQQGAWTCAQTHAWYRPATPTNYTLRNPV